MLYKNMIPNKTYSNTPVLVLPKDITIKKDDKDVHQPFMFIMLADSVEDSIELLNTPALSIPLRNMKVNKCFIPSRMNERIGTTLVNDMLKNSILPKFREGIKSENPSMRVIDSVGLSSIKADSNSNIIYNMAPELEYFMRYRFRKNRLNQVDDFFKFLNMRFDNHFDTRFNDYLRIFYVPLDIWTKKASNGFGVGKDSLDNPLSLFMAAAYYHEDIFDSLPGDFRILLHDRTRNQSMYITKEFLTKKKFSQLKRQLAIFHQFVYKEAPEDERVEIDKPGDGKLTSVDKINDTKDALQDEILNEVKKRMTHAFTGDDPIILPGKFVTDDDIEEALKNVRYESILEKIIIRKININNIFKITRWIYGSTNELIYKLKARDVEDFIKSLTKENIFKILNDYDTPNSIAKRIYEERKDLIPIAIKHASKETLEDLLFRERIPELVNQIKILLMK